MTYPMIINRKSKYYNARKVVGQMLSDRSRFMSNPSQYSRLKKWSNRYKAMDNQLVTKRQLKNEIAKASPNMGKEVTAVTTTYTPGNMFVDYRSCKNIDKGNDQGDRLRSVIHLSGLRIFGSFRHGGASNPNILVRMVTVIDKQPGKDANIDFFQTSGDSRNPSDFVIGAGGTIGAISAIRPLNKDRFTILDDRKWSLTRESIDPNSSYVTFRYWVPVKRTVTFGPDYNTVANDITPAVRVLYFAVNSDNSLSGTAILSASLQFEEFFRN